MADRVPLGGVDQQELQEMRQLCGGEEEWRVEHPVTGSYCFHGSKRECRDWLAEHQAGFPNSPYSGYVVKQRFVQSSVQVALERCIDELERMRAVPAIAAVLALPPAAPDQTSANPFEHLPDGRGRRG